jgi:hypothetical protein
MAERYPRSGPGGVADIGYAPAISAGVFTLFVVAGSAYIVAAKLRGTTQVYVTFVPVAIMLAYALLIYLARNLRLRDDQAGDNLYYMGFLFTLTSLGVSLYQFNAARAAEEIVQNFGIAIGSTITGIALRVVFNQMRRDPIEVERIMRLELAEAARRVRRELDSTVVEFGYVRRSAQQAAADSFNQVAERFDAIAAKMLAIMEDVASKTARPLEAASRRSGDTIGQMTRTMVGALATSTRQLILETERLSTSAVQISAALDEVTAKLATMRMPDGVVEVRVDLAVQTLVQAIDRFTAQSREQTAVIADVLAAAKVAAESSSASVIAQRQELDANSVANRAALEAATRIITAMTQILDEFKAGARDQVEMLQHLLERTDGTIRTFTDVLIKSGVDMAVQSDGLRDVLPAMQASAQTLALATEKVADLADDLRSRRVAPRALSD